MSKFINAYFDLERAAQVVRERQHRGFVGGLWDELGQLQIDFAIARGLKPDSYMLDVGCGCLRGGVRFVEFLNPGHYFGIDISEDLLDAGYDVELGSLELQHKLPRTNLAATGNFDASEFGREFDFAMAQSVFTHLPMNHIRVCLKRIARVVRVGGEFHATFFLCPNDHEWDQPLLHERGQITTYPDSDPFHYRETDLKYFVDGLPWRWDLIGDWDHPRNQKMVVFTRT